MKKEMTSHSIVDADIVIKPKQIEDVGFFEFNQVGKTIREERVCQENDTSNEEGSGGILKGKEKNKKN